MFITGDIVVRWRSKASTLKRRTYRVEQVQSSGYIGKVLCRDPFGKQREFKDYQLVRIDRLIDGVRGELYTHDQKRIELQNRINKLEQEMRELKLYFPSI